MKRIIAGILALAMIISVTACDSQGQNSNIDAQESNAQESGAEETSGAAVEGAIPGLTGSFSEHPVAVDEDGKVDMDVALQYETDVDALIEELEAQPVDGSKPVSKNANEETIALFNFLKENYGKKIISGQQMFDDAHYEDLVYYIETGDLPAIKGFDFLFSTGNQQWNDYQIDEAIKCHTQQNGIVALCWHWQVPIDINDPEGPGIAFYSENIKNFSLANAVTPGTEEYKIIIRDIDTVALKLQKLEAAGVPVLWRPLHEASGLWFWWGQDREGFKNQLYQKLWYMVFDRLENYHKLTNLIWVWNGQSKSTEVNPNTYDIGGMDIYPNTEDHSPQETQYNTLTKTMNENKMAAITECGYIPDPDELFAEDTKAKWLYYLPWYGDFICNATESGMILTELGGTPSVNTKRISSEMLKKVFASDKVITLSELPDWSDTAKYIPQYIKSWQFDNPDVKTAESKLTAYSEENPEE